MNPHGTMIYVLFSTKIKKGQILPQEKGMPKKTRGRPKAFDDSQVLEAAKSCFWSAGFSGTTIDDLCEAMNINKPTFYASFKSKKNLYIKALDVFSELVVANINSTLLAEPDIKTAFIRFYDGMLDLYFEGAKGRGCFVFSTTAIEAITDKESRSYLKNAIKSLESMMEKRIQMAVDDGELPKSTDVSAKTSLACATLNYINLKARSGEAQSELKKLVRMNVKAIF